MTYRSVCRCLNCNEVLDDKPNGARFLNRFADLRFCASCGMSDGAYDSVEKWVPSKRSLNPGTWFAGKWVPREVWLARTNEASDQSRAHEHGEGGAQ